MSEPITAPASIALPHTASAPHHSLPVQEMMGRTPHWVLRSGTTAIAIATGVGLLLACLVKYPDTIPGHITLTGTNPPAAVVARQSGHLEKLVVKERDLVRKGQLLGLIQNPAKCDRVLALRDTLSALRPFLSNPENFVSLPLEQESELGAVQIPYSEFHLHYREYEVLLSDKYAETTRAALEKQLGHKRNEATLIRRQVENMERDSELARQSYARYQTLYKQRGVSLAELQAQERLYLEQQRQHATLTKNLNEEEIAVSEYEKQIRDLTHKRTDDLRSARMQLAESLKKLFSAIDLWESDYVLRSPTDGMVAFYDFWSDQQFVSAGKQVFVIVPDTTQLLGRAAVKSAGAGKIKPGQRVRIRFDDFPDREFGSVEGTVQSISLVAQEGNQLVTVALAYPLKSSYGKEIPFKQEMTGDATIITEDRVLIQRVFDDARSNL